MSDSAQTRMKRISPTSTKYVCATAVHPLDTERKPNAFDWIGQAVQIAPTRVSKKAATRINQERSLNGGLTNSQKAPR